MTLDPAGRYRSVRSAQWATFGPLSPDARLTMLAILTGSSANLAGIAFLSREILSRETALSVSQLERALSELEKLPTPARAFILRDDSVIWARTALEDAPGVLDVRQHFVNDRHRRGVRAILGSLPATSTVVQKFKRHYRLALQAPSHVASQGAKQGATKVRRAETESREQRTETETEREIQEGKPTRECSTVAGGAASPSPAVEAGFGSAVNGLASERQQPPRRIAPPPGRFEEIVNKIMLQRPDVQRKQAEELALHEFARETV